MNKIMKKIQHMPLTVKASVAYVVCSILQKSLSFITLPLFTRILTTEQYGQYSVYASWSAIIGIFVTLNLGYGSFDTAMSKYDKQRKEYIASVQGISILLTALFLCFYLPFQKIWNGIFELPTFLVVIMIIELLAQSSLQFWNNKNKFEFKYKANIAVTLLISVLSPAIAVFFVFNSQERGYARIIGYALVNIVVGTFFLLYNLIKGKKFYNAKFWRFALKFNIPLIPYYLSQVVFNQSDKIMISKFCGEGKAGIYSVAYSLAMILTFVLNAINSSYVPWFYEAIKKKNLKANRNVACGISLIMALLLSGVIWLTPEIIYVMAGKAYYEAIWVVPPVAMSVLLLFYAQLAINTAFFYEKKKILVWSSISSAILNIVLNALFIPMFGFVAAGYTTLVSYIVFAYANYKGTKKHVAQEFDFDEAYDIKRLLFILMGFTMITFVAMMFYEMAIVRYIIMLIVCICIIINYKKILKLIKQFV